MPQDDRTEKATPKRRGQAREKGQVARSLDLTNAGVLLAGLFGLMLMAPKVLAASASAMTSIFGQISRPHNVVSAAGLHGLLKLTETTVLKTVGPIAGICVAGGVVLNLLQVGIRFTPKSVRVNFSVLNPIHGFKTLFSPKSTVTLIKAMVKMAIVGGLVALALIPDLTKMGAGVGTTPYGLGVLIFSRSRCARADLPAGDRLVRRSPGLQGGVVSDDHGGDQEEEEIINRECRLGPVAVRAGDGEGDRVLDDQNEPHQAVGMGEAPAAENPGLGPYQDPEGDEDQDAEIDGGRDNSR